MKIFTPEEIDANLKEEDVRKPLFLLKFEVLKILDERIKSLKDVLDDKIVMIGLNVDERTVKACIKELQLLRKRITGEDK